MSNTDGGRPGQQEIRDSLSAAMAGDVTAIHMLLTPEIEILPPTAAHGIWAMADASSTLPRKASSSSRRGT
jgi:hypothetical protein